MSHDIYLSLKQTSNDKFMLNECKHNQYHHIYVMGAIEVVSNNKLGRFSYMLRDVIHITCW